MKSFVKTLAAGALLAASMGIAQAENVRPYVLAYKTSGDLAAAVEAAKAKVTAAGFEIVGEYSPYATAHIIAITSADLKSAAGSSDFGGYGAAIRVGVTKVGEEIQVSYNNPVYQAAAYRLGADNAAVLAKLQSGLGNENTFGTFGRYEESAGVNTDELRKYHYMVGMEYFDDPSELASYDDYAAAKKAVEDGLAAGNGGAKKVYSIDIPGKNETVYGVALTDAGCSGDEFIMSKIDHAPLRATPHLPYEILVSDKDVYALYARFRIAISFIQLPMIQSATGATFFNIMCAPGAIEEALEKAAGAT
jgi:hypothetical protein